MRTSLPLFVVLFSFAATASGAVPISGTYSSLYYNEEGGDLLGIEVTIVHEASGYRARFQIAEGDASKIVEVPVEVHGSRVSFLIPLNDEGGGRYSGTIGHRGLLLTDGAKAAWSLSGRVQEPNGPFLLVRKCSYWDTCPAAAKLQSH